MFLLCLSAFIYTRYSDTRRELRGLCKAVSTFDLAADAGVINTRVLI